MKFASSKRAKVIAGALLIAIPLLAGFVFISSTGVHIQPGAETYFFYIVGFLAMSACVLVPLGIAVLISSSGQPSSAEKDK